ncbi:MAG: redoxin family protein [Ginsengibacter sp.]
MKLIYCLMIFLCPFVSKSQIVKPLTVGDDLPGMRIKNVLNKRTPTINLKQYKGKTLLIHFLITTCPSCVASSKKYDALLKKFNGNLKVLIVTSESRERVEKFMKRFPSYFGHVPVVVHDSTLRKLFPYEYVSHIIWINPAGKVAAITGNEYVTADNISLVNKGTQPGWPIKRDITSFDKEIALLKLNDGNVPYTSIPADIFYSAFFSNLQDLPVSIYQNIDSFSNGRRTLYVNHTIPQLYMRAYDLQAFPATHILLSTPDARYYFYESKKYYRAAWENSNTYSYECLVPAVYSKDEVSKRMKNDLDFYLGTKGYLKDTIVSSLVLVQRAESKLPFLDSAGKEGRWIAIRNIITHLNDQPLSLPVINNVPALANKYVAIDPKLVSDRNELQKHLALYGLALIEKPSRIHALVIKQENNFHFKHSPKPYSK